MDKKYIVIFIAVLLIAISLLGGRLLLKQQTQLVNTTPIIKQQTNDNSQQEGLDLPGQPVGKEGGAPGGVGN